MQQLHFALDIDKTQIQERLKKTRENKRETKSIETLKNRLSTLSDDGHLITFVSNGMLHLYEGQPCEQQLATPTYLGASANTILYKRVGNKLIEDPNWTAAVKKSCSFNPKKLSSIITSSPFSDFLIPKETEHETNLKISFDIARDYRLSQHKTLFQALSGLFQEETGIDVFYVEGDYGSDGHPAVIDILPTLCTKGGIITHINQEENIAPENTVVFGNGNNDISMFKEAYRCVAVGNSSDALKQHVENMPDSNRHLVAKGVRAQSVLNGLKKLGL